MSIPESGALSRQFNEGGYTFLKRTLAQNLRTGVPVTINTGSLYLQYSYQEGHANFMQGVTVLRGQDTDAMERFASVAEKYDVKQGLREISAEVRTPLAMQPTFLKRLRSHLFRS